MVCPLFMFSRNFLYNHSKRKKSQMLKYQALSIITISWTVRSTILQLTTYAIKKHLEKHFCKLNIFIIFYINAYSLKNIHIAPVFLRVHCFSAQLFLLAPSLTHSYNFLAASAPSTHPPPSYIQFPFGNPSAGLYTQKRASWTPWLLSYVTGHRSALPIYRYHH